MGAKRKNQERDIKIFEFRKQGVSLKDLAERHGLTVARVCQIVKAEEAQDKTQPSEVAAVEVEQNG